MERFIIRENLRRYRNRLQSEKDHGTRETLIRLIADEEAKLREVERKEARQKSHSTSG
jgi:hypothetical protein